MTDYDGIEALIEEALIKEAHGYQFYVTLAQQCGDGSDTNLTLTRLATEEVKHFGVLAEILAAFEESGDLISLDEAETRLQPFKPTLQKLLGFVDQPFAGDEDVYRRARDIAEGAACSLDDGLAVGIEVEKKSIEYYQKLKEQADGALVGVLDQLIEDEHRHKDLLERTRNGEGRFFAEDEIYAF